MEKKRKYFSPEYTAEALKLAHHIHVELHEAGYSHDIKTV